MNPRRAPLYALMFALGLSACSSTGAPHAPPPLYEAVGGEAGIGLLTDDFLARVHNDPRIAELFVNVDPADLKRLVVEQLCEAFGGPCVYSGRSMPDAHSGLALTDADFDAFVEDLGASMNALAVPAETQGRIVSLLAPMRGDIVGQ